MSKYAKELPSSPEERKAVLTEVDKIVDALLEIQSLQDLIKDSKTYCQDKYEVCGGYVKSLADIKYDILYNERKKADKIAEQAELVEFVEGFNSLVK